MATIIDEVKGNLSSARKELAECLPRLNEEMADWAPAAGMRTVKGQLVEMAATEESIVLTLQGKAPENFGALDKFYKDLPTMAATIAALDELRGRTLAYIDELGEEGLKQPANIWDGFHKYLDLQPASNGEILRYIARHEAYHTGQLVSYLWARGDDPYKW